MAKDLGDLFPLAESEEVVQPPVDTATETETQTEAPPDTQDTATEPKKGDNVPEKETTPPETASYNFEDFNSRFSTSFKDDADVTSFLEKVNKTEELEKSVKEHSEYKTKNQELEAKLEVLEKGLDPLKYFANEQEFKAQQLKMKFPDKDHYTIQKIMDKDLSKMSDLEVLALKTLLDTPGILGGEAGAKEYVQREFYGEDVTEEEADDFTKNKLTIAATKARNEMNGFKQVELPKVQTAEDRQTALEAQKQAIKDEWSPYMEQLTTPGKLEIKDKDGNKLFDFEVSETDGFKEYFETMFAEGGITPTEESIGIAMEARNKEIIYDHLPEILSVYANKLKGEVLENTDKELHNDKLPNTAEKTDDEATKAASGVSQFIHDAKSTVGGQTLG